MFLSYATYFMSLVKCIYKVLLYLLLMWTKIGLEWRLLWWSICTCVTVKTLSNSDIVTAWISWIMLTSRKMQVLK